MNLKENPCPYCGGTKFIGTAHKTIITMGKKAIYTYGVPCYCEISAQIRKKFTILSKYPVVPPVDASEVHKRYSDKNMIFYGDEDLFLYTVKSFFTKGFITKDYMVLEGMEIVDKYHAPKEDGSRLTLLALNQYDLLVILFTSQSEYKTLKSSVCEVIKNRYRLGKSTWIYSRDEGTLKGSKDYSQDLDQYFEKYVKVRLTVNAYKGYFAGVTGKISAKMSRDTQDRLSNL